MASCSLPSCATWVRATVGVSARLRRRSRCRRRPQSRRPTAPPRVRGRRRGIVAEASRTTVATGAPRALRTLVHARRQQAATGAAAHRHFKRVDTRRVLGPRKVLQRGRQAVSVVHRRRPLSCGGREDVVVLLVLLLLGSAALGPAAAACAAAQRQQVARRASLMSLSKPSSSAYAIARVQRPARSAPAAAWACAETGSRLPLRLALRALAAAGAGEDGRLRVARVPDDAHATRGSGSDTPALTWRGLSNF